MNKISDEQTTPRLLTSIIPNSLLDTSLSFFSEPGPSLALGSMPSFSCDLQSHSFVGFLNKKTKYRKQWKRRFFEIKGRLARRICSLLDHLPFLPSSRLLSDGLIKYYTSAHDNLETGNGLRGIFDLTGVRILPLTLDSPREIHLMTPQDRKTEIVFEADTLEEVSCPCHSVPYHCLSLFSVPVSIFHLVFLERKSSQSFTEWHCDQKYDRLSELISPP
jgi:hypothetical protein